MTQTQIIYDNEGYIISIRQGEPAPRNPIGVPFLNVEIPSGKQIKITDGVGVDVTKTPHEVILEDVPPSEVEVMRDEVTGLNNALLEVYEMLILGGI